MINEEVSRSSLNLEVRLAKATAKALFDAIKKLYKQIQDQGGLANVIKNNGEEVKLKDMVKKGQLEEINLKDPELKELKKILNKHGVKFSIMKDKETGNHSVFFQSKDIKVMEHAFKKAVKKAEKKADRKESITKSINKFKDMAKDTITKDKIKNKHKEQSL